MLLGIKIDIFVHYYSFSNQNEGAHDVSAQAYTMPTDRPRKVRKQLRRSNKLSLVGSPRLLLPLGDSWQIKESNSSI